MRRKRSRFSSTPAVPERAVLAGPVEVSAVLADLLGRQVVDVSLAGADQVLGELVDPLEVVRGVQRLAVPAEAQPGDVFADRIDVLDILGARVGVVEAQVALATVPGRGPKLRQIDLACPMCR